MPPAYGVHAELALMRLRDVAGIDTEIVTSALALSCCMPEWVSLLAGDDCLGGASFRTLVEAGGDDSAFRGLGTRAGGLVSCSFAVRLRGDRTDDDARLHSAALDVLENRLTIGRPVRLAILFPCGSRYARSRDFEGLGRLHGISGVDEAVFGPVSVVLLRSTEDVLLRRNLPSLCAMLGDPPPGAVIAGNAEPGGALIPPCDAAALDWGRLAGLPGCCQWFNPASPRVLVPPPDGQEARIDRIPRDLDGFDPLAGLLGVCPDGFRDAVSWLCPGADGAIGPAPRKVVDALVTQIQLTLVRGFHDIWLSRCALMDSWWRRSMTPARVRLLLLDLARRNTAKKAARERAARAKFDQMSSRRTAERARDPLALANSWGEDRATSSRLRRSPRPQHPEPGFSTEGESLEEQAEWLHGLPSVRARLSHLRVPRF